MKRNEIMGIVENCRMELKERKNTMKIKHGMLISKEDIQKIKDANESVRGTSDYTKYKMEYDYRTYDEEKGKWGRYKFLGMGSIIHDYGQSNSGYHIEIYRGNIYIRSSMYKELNKKRTDSFLVTDAIMELLDWQV